MSSNVQIIDRTLLRVGDVFKHAGKFVVVYKVLEAWASVQPCARKQREVIARDFEGEANTKTIKFAVPEKSFNISAHSEVEIIARLGDDWKTKNLANEVPGFVGEPINTGSGENSMSKKAISNPRGGLAAAAKATKSTKTPKTPKAEGEGRQGQLGNVCGHSVTSVLRALGKHGVTAAQARGIFVAKSPEAKAMGLPVTVAPGTVSIQIGKGKAGTMDPAPLTKEQVAGLKALIPEVVEEPKSEKKTKSKKTKAAPATETAATESAAPASTEAK